MAVIPELPIEQQALSESDAVAAFKALGDPTRLRIYRFLCECCCPVAVEESGEVRTVDGPTAGEVCCQISGADKINSTISHHLKELRLAGLITIERRGKHRVCGVNREFARILAQFLDNAASNGSNCCGG